MDSFDEVVMDMVSLEMVKCTATVVTETMQPTCRVEGDIRDKELVANSKLSAVPYTVSVSVCVFTVHWNKYEVNKGLSLSELSLEKDSEHQGYWSGCFRRIQGIWLCQIRTL